MTYMDRTDYHPYNLKIVPHAEVDPKNFFTMSAAGVTHFINGVAGNNESLTHKIYLFSTRIYNVGSVGSRVRDLRESKDDSNLPKVQNVEAVSVVAFILNEH